MPFVNNGFEEVWQNPSNVTNGGATTVASPSYEAIVDQVKQNNAWSAEQAQKQMDYQERLFREQQVFNMNEAEKNRDFQQDSANMAMDFSAEEAAKNREWQEYMSSSAHKREMDDLKAAGLNPILAAHSGASMGSGASASSAQAVGNAAASVANPSGAKGDTDESGTTAIMSLLSKMLDNQIAREQMQVSAETALNTADMYTAATRYAAELGQIASQYGANLSNEGTHYSADRSYEASLNNIYNLIGSFVGDFAKSSGVSGSSAASLVKDTISELGNGKTVDSINRTLRYIDSGGKGNNYSNVMSPGNIVRMAKNAIKRVLG